VGLVERGQPILVCVTSAKTEQHPDQNTSRCSMKSTSVNLVFYCVAGWWVAHSAAAVQQVLNESSMLSSAATRPAAAAEGLPQSALQVHLRAALQGLPQTALDKCLVPVRLQMLGKGVPEAGAAILIPMSQHESSSHQPSHAKETQAIATDLNSEQVAADKQVIDQRNDAEISSDDLMDVPQPVDKDCDHDRSTVELEHERQSASKRAKLADNVLDEGKPQPNMTAQASDMTAVVDNEASAEAEAAADAEGVYTSVAHMTSDDTRDEEEEQHRKRHHEAMSSTRTVDGQQIVIGVVTTEAPRGVSGVAGPRAICSLAALTHLYGQQLATRLIRSSHHGIVVQCQNQGSTKHSRAALHCMYDMCWQHLLAY